MTQLEEVKKELLDEYNKLRREGNKEYFQTGQLLMGYPYNMTYKELKEQHIN